jgi:hypothetical protein
MRHVKGCVDCASCKNLVVKCSSYLAGAYHLVEVEHQCSHLTCRTWQGGGYQTTPEMAS